MATPNYIDGASGTKKGVGAAESGMKIESVVTTVENPRIYTQDEDGCNDGFVEDYNPSVTIAITGEIVSTAGPVAAQFGTAITLANEGDAVTTASTFFGVANTGGFYLSGTPTVTSNRGELKTISLEFMSHPEIG